jgi:hypothetical protein
MAAAKDGESKGLNRKFVSNFFAAQIEANKLVQYSLLAEWHRASRAPRHPPVSLTEDIRPQLDQIEADLIAELVKTDDIRTNASCRDNTAKAVSKYLAHRHLGTLLAIALDRAMEASCSGPTAGKEVERTNKHLACPPVVNELTLLTSPSARPEPRVENPVGCLSMFWPNSGADEVSTHP